MDERRPPTADFKFKFRCLPDEELNEQRERPLLPSLPLFSPYFFVFWLPEIICFIVVFLPFPRISLSFSLSIAQATRKPFHC